MNGIGGETVEEAKERMTHVEAKRWHAFIEKYGTLHLGVRMEVGFAMLALMINKALGGHADLRTFMPFSLAPKDDDEGEATLEDVMGILMKARR